MQSVADGGISVVDGEKQSKVGHVVGWVMGGQFGEVSVVLEV